MPRIIDTSNPVVTRNPLVEKRGWRKKEWAQAVGFGPSQVAEWIRDGEIESVRIGGARVILTPPERFLNSYRERA